MTQPRQLLIYREVPDAESVAKLKRFSVADAEGWLLFPLNSTVVLPEQIANTKTALASLGLIRWVSDYRDRFDCEVGHLGDRLETFAQAVRGTVVDGKRVEEHLTCPGMGSAWWFSLLQERNPLLYPGWNDWAKLAMIERFLEEHDFDRIAVIGGGSLLLQAIERVVVARNASVATRLRIIRKDGGDATELAQSRSVLRDLLSGFREWVLLGSRILQARSLKTAGKRSSESASVIHVGYYPAADPIAAKQGMFRNKYLGPLQSIIEEERASLGFLFYTVPGHTTLFKRCLREIVQFRDTGARMNLQEEYLKVSDWLGLGMRWIGLFVKSSRLRQPLAKTLIEKNLLKESETSLFASIWNESFRSHLAVKAGFNFLSFRNFLELVPKETLIVYAAEFQSWEYMFNAAANSVEHHHVVAAIQGNPARHYFQYRFNKTGKEIGCGFPKRIIGFSPLFDTLEGIDEAEIRRGSAIRLMHLQGFEKQIATHATAKKAGQLGVLGAGSYNECVLMLEMLHASLGKLSDKIFVRLRLHPVIALKRLSTMLSFDLKASEFEIDTGSMQDLLTDSTGIYVSNSTSAIEALAYGCEVISPRYFGRLSLCPLDGHETYYWRVSGERELALAIEEIMRGKKRAAPDKTAQFISGLVNLDPSYSTWKELIRNNHS